VTGFREKHNLLAVPGVVKYSGHLFLGHSVVTIAVRQQNRTVNRVVLEN